LITWGADVDCGAGGYQRHIKMGGLDAARAAAAIRQFERARR
jgi:hypothetical protein